MTFLPIVVRELSVTARRAGTYWLRFWAALVMLAIWLFLLSNARRAPPAEMGQLLLNALGILAFLFTLLAGAFLTADCLSEEKREGTLGLLFLTDLKSYDVVLGKLAACSLHAFFGLLATFPILGLTLLVGGVTGREFALLMLVFGVTLFFSLGVGMFVSAVSHEARQAMSRTFLLVLVFAGLFPVLMGVQALVYGNPGVVPGQGRLATDYLAFSSPVFTYQEAFESYYRRGTGAHDFWLSLAVVFCLGLAGIALAGALLPRAWRRLDSEAAPKTPPVWRRPIFTRESAVRRATLLDRNPIYWLGTRNAGSTRTAVRVLALLALFWFCLLMGMIYDFGGNGTDFFGVCMYLTYGLHIIAKVLIATEASRRFSQDRQSGALELLLATPISISSILTGQQQSLRHNFRVPLAILFLVNFAICVAVLMSGKVLHMDGEDMAMFLEVFLGGLLLLLADFQALSWVGMWRGLNSAKQPRAVAGTLGRVMGPAWLAVFLLIFVSPAFRGRGAVALTMAMWIVFGLVVDAILITTARQRLQARFRRVVAQRYEAKG